jgi:hypothetical protein
MSRAIVALVMLGCNADVPAPMIASVFPDHGRPGTSVMIEGNHFCQQPADPGDDQDPLACDNTGTVSFDQQPAEVLQYLDTAIMVTVPEHDPNPVNVVVHVLGRTSNDVTFTVTP